MPTTLCLRFQKRDQFGNPIFIASSKNPEEKDQHATLSKFYNQLDSLDTGLFLPIYSNTEHDYATLKCKKNTNFCNLIAGNTYKVTFDTKKKKTDGVTTSINCYIRKLKFFKKGEPVDEGESVDFD